MTQAPSAQAVTLKKLPPYAKAINDARRKGMVPTRGGLGHIAIGFEWRQGIVPDFHVVVVPPERDPAEFEWRFTAGLDVFVMHSDRDIPHLHALCCALFAAKAHDVQTFNMDKRTVNHTTHAAREQIVHSVAGGS